MKNIYDLLNNVKVDTEDYEVTPLNDIEKASMKQNFHRSEKLSKKKAPYRWATAAACMVCVISFSQTAFAQTAINGILQKISLGHNEVVQVDPAKPTSSTPMFYDKNGKPITHIDGTVDIYDASGKWIATVTGKKASSEDKGCAIEKDLNKAVSKLNFKPALPKELPANYAYDHTSLFLDEKGKTSGDYAIFNYKNGDKSIKVNENRITPETAHATATDGTVEKLKVNGHDAALVDGHRIEWESNGVSISITAESLTRDELLTLAKSFA